jgi:PAS domain S-box-containing protein
MKIRTRVKIAGGLAFCLLLAYSAWAIYSYRVEKQMTREAKEAKEITNRIFILRALTDDFLALPTERAQRQWLAVYEELLRLLDEPESREIQKKYGISDTIDRLKTIEATFFRLRRLQEDSGRNFPEAGTGTELHNRLRTQLMLAAENVVSKTSRMDDEIIAKLTSLHRAESAFDLLSIVVLGLIIISTGVFLQRSVVKPLRKLHEGAEIIGAGNLDYKIGINTRDEIGELTRAFDRMTANLQQVTVSRDDLVREIGERQRAEEALRKSEERLRLALDAAYLVSFEWDIQRNEVRRFTSADPTLPPTAEEAPSTFEAVREVIHPEDRELFTANVYAAMERENGRYENEFRLNRPGGEIVWIYEHGSVKRDEQGRPARLVGLSQDITERKKSEAALRDSREDLNRAQAVAQTGSWRLDVQRNELTWSDENHRIFGIPLGSPMTYETFLSTVHPEDRDYVDRKWTAALKGEPYDIEHRIVVDGEVKWVRERAELEFDSKGRLLGGFGTTQDITERKRTEEALRESEERFRKIFENAATGIAITDWEGRFQQCNPAYCALLGYTEKEFRRLEFASLIHPEDRNANLAKVHRLQDGELPFFQIENRYVRKDGQTVWVHKFVSVLPDARGKPAHLVALVTDITERKRTEEALKQARGELEQKVIERTADLRRTVEQLQWEIGERQQMEESLCESEERLRFLASQLLIAQETERNRLALELHDDLGQSLMVLKLQLRAAESKLPPDLSVVKDKLGYALGYIDEVIANVRRMCHELRPSVLKDLGLKAALNNLFEEFSEVEEIQLSLDMEDIQGLLSQEAQIAVYRIFQESLTNIAKHAQATRIKASVKRQDGDVAFRLEDNGSGFDLQGVLSGDLTKRGLGLTAMHERVRLLEGKLDISSRPGIGTTISFHIPINRNGI